LQTLLAPYVGKLDALVLGCTHYPFVKDTIAKIMGADTVLLDGGEGTAKQTRRCLEKAGLRNDGPGSIQIENSRQDSKILELSMALLQ
jgi:glutamate racemase